MKKYLDLILKDSFLSGVSKLASTTVIAQAIALVSLPILTRLYPSSSFGTLSLYLSVLSISVAISTLNYEVAIPSPKDDVDGLHILLLCFSLITIETLLFSLILYVFNEPLFTFINVEELIPYYYMVPSGFFFVATFTSISYYCLRCRAYGDIARSRIVQSTVQSITQIGMGYFGVGTIGLLLGDIANQSAGSLGLFVKNIKKSLIQNFGKLSLSRLKLLIVKYKKFPLFGLPSDLLITLGVSLPPIFIAQGWGLETLGFYMMALKISDIPFAILGRSIGRVYLAEAMTINNESKEGFAAFFKQTSKRLLVMSALIVPTFSLAFYYLSPFVLGSEWQVAGLYSLLLIPLVFSRFVVAPISQTSSVLHKQNIELIISAIRVISIVAVFKVSIWSSWSFDRTLLTYSVISALLYGTFYSVYIYLAHSCSKGSDKC